MATRLLSCCPRLPLLLSLLFREAISFLCDFRLCPCQGGSETLGARYWFQAKVFKELCPGECLFENQLTLAESVGRTEGSHE